MGDNVIKFGKAKKGAQKSISGETSSQA